MQWIEIDVADEKAANNSLIITSTIISLSRDKFVSPTKALESEGNLTHN